MSLSKQQMIGAVGAGIFVVCAGGLGWMLYSAWSDKGEVETKVTEETDAFRRFNEAAVYPSKASIDSVKSNATSYVEWYDSAETLAARGDRAMQIESASKFKQLLEREVRRIRELPGGAGGKISAPTFLFGFEQYLGEGGVLPKDAEVPRLAVQLESICRLADAFAEAGVYEVKSVTRLSAKVEKQDEAEADSSSSSAKGKKPSSKKEAADAPKMTKESYAFEILARPTAIVQVLNKLTACERFVVVRNLSFRQSVDSIVDHIAAAKKAEDAKNAPSTGLRRRRGAAAAPADANPEALALASRIVADPEGDEPLTVSFTLDVYDFGRPAQASAAQEAKDADAAPADAGKADSAKPSAADAKAEEKKPAEKKAEKGDFE
jgi:hypothetical protein